MKSDTHPKSGETRNSIRAGWARVALNAFTRTTYGQRNFNTLCREDQETAIYDLICDLLHLCQSRRFDPVACTRRALDHFTVEREQEGRAPIPALADILAANAMREPQPDTRAALAVAVSGIASLLTQLEVVARFILDGEPMEGEDEEGEPIMCEMSIDDAYTTASESVAVARTVAEQGRALLNRLGLMVSQPGDMIDGRDSLLHPHPSDPQPTAWAASVLRDLSDAVSDLVEQLGDKAAHYKMDRLHSAYHAARALAGHGPERRASPDRRKEVLIPMIERRAFNGHTFGVERRKELTPNG